MVKFLIIGDLHGNIPKLYYKDFDAIIAPGDFCSDAPRKFMFKALKERINNSNSDLEWYDICGKNKAKSMIKKSLKDGRKILKLLNSYNKPIFALPGNWDWTEKDPNFKYLNKNYWKTYLIKDLKNIKDCHKKTLNFKGLNIIGHGITSGPEFPIHKLNKLTKKEISQKKKEYNKLFKTMDNKFMKTNHQTNKTFRKTKSPISKKQIIFLTHNVPYKTKLDKINNPKSPRNGQHMGSFLARELIDKHQPLIAIGGHMHEHFGKTKIKKTTIVNAGFGSNVNTILEIENNKIKKLEFIKKGKVI